MAKYDDSSFARTSRYLDENGIDPALVAGDESFTTKSYYVVVQDDDGNMMRDGDEFITKETQWPSLTVAIRAVELYLTEKREHEESRSSRRVVKL